MRPDASHDPAIKLVVEPSDVGALEVLAPPAQNRIDSLYQLACGCRRCATCELAYLILETTDRLLPRVRIQRAGFRATFDLVGRQPHRPIAALDLVAEELKSVPDMHDPRLARIDAHAQLLQDSTCRLQRRSRLCRRSTGNAPVIGVPRELV